MGEIMRMQLTSINQHLRSGIQRHRKSVKWIKPRLREAHYINGRSKRNGITQSLYLLFPRLQLRKNRMQLPRRSGLRNLLDTLKSKIDVIVQGLQPREIVSSICKDLCSLDWFLVCGLCERDLEGAFPWAAWLRLGALAACCIRLRSRSRWLHGLEVLGCKLEFLALANYYSRGLGGMLFDAWD
jgi:hypothetical protein